jgi:hypothetical protein
MPLPENKHGGPDFHWVDEREPSAPGKTPMGIAITVFKGVDCDCLPGLMPQLSRPQSPRLRVAIPERSATYSNPKGVRYATT